MKRLESLRVSAVTWQEWPVVRSRTDEQNSRSRIPTTSCRFCHGMPHPRCGRAREIDDGEADGGPKINQNVVDWLNSTVRIAPIQPASDRGRNLNWAEQIRTGCPLPAPQRSTPCPRPTRFSFLRGGDACLAGRKMGRAAPLRPLIEQKICCFQRRVDAVAVVVGGSQKEVDRRAKPIARVGDRGHSGTSSYCVSIANRSPAKAKRYPAIRTRLFISGASGEILNPAARSPASFPYLEMAHRFSRARWPQCRSSIQSPCRKPGRTPWPSPETFPLSAPEHHSGCRRSI